MTARPDSAGPQNALVSKATRRAALLLVSIPQSADRVCGKAWRLQKGNLLAICDRAHPRRDDEIAAFDSVQDFDGIALKATGLDASA